MSNRSNRPGKSGRPAGRPSPADPVPLEDFAPFRCVGGEAAFYRLPLLQPQAAESAPELAGATEPWADVYRVLAREGAASKPRFPACLMRLTAMMRIAAAGGLADWVRPASGEAGFALVHGVAVRAAASFPMVRLGYFDAVGFVREVVRLAAGERP